MKDGTNRAILVSTLTLVLVLSYQQCAPVRLEAVNASGEFEKAVKGEEPVQDGIGSGSESPASSGQISSITIAENEGLRQGDVPASGGGTTVNHADNVSISLIDVPRVPCDDGQSVRCVEICHFPQAFKGEVIKGITLAIGPEAVEAHLTNHNGLGPSHDQLGKCD